MNDDFFYIKWYAWHPVKINGKYFWGEHVLRRFIGDEENGGYFIYKECK